MTEPFKIGIVNELDCGCFKIVPHRNNFDGTITLYYPDGSGEWAERVIRKGQIAPLDFKPLLLSDDWAKTLFLSLKKIFEPREEKTVSIDAVEKMDDHLQDMRKIAFSKLGIT